MDLYNVARVLFSLEKGKYSSVLQSCLDAAIDFINTWDTLQRVTVYRDIQISRDLSPSVYKAACGYEERWHFS